MFYCLADALLALGLKMNVGIPSLAFFFGNTGGGELLVILFVLLLLFGARRLPELARALGRAIGELQRMAHDFTREVMEPPQPPSDPPTKTSDAIVSPNEPPEYRG